jgi:hypothetical protein
VAACPMLRAQRWLTHQFPPPPAAPAQHSAAQRSTAQHSTARLAYQSQQLLINNRCAGSWPSTAIQHAVPGVVSSILKSLKHNKARSATMYLDGIIPPMLLQPGKHTRLAARDAASTRFVRGEIGLICSDAQLHPEADHRTDGSHPGCTTQLQAVSCRLEQHPAVAHSVMAAPAPVAHAFTPPALRLLCVACKCTCVR